MARLLVAALLVAAASATDVCFVPHHARSGLLAKLACPGFNETQVGGPAAQTKTTPLDHGDSGAGTFTQRYWVNTAYWKGPGGPMFLSVGGEGPARAPGGWVLDLARTFGGMAASVEHRFYGESMPGGDPNVGLRAPNLQYLTVAQALQDVNDAIATIRTQYAMSASAPVVLVGGSYPGALVGWHRVAYPSQSVAGLASSGVVNAILEYTAFDNVIAAALPAACRDVVRATTAAFDAAEQDPTTAKAARALFNAPETMSVPDFAYMIADSAAMAVQYGTKALLCAAMQPSDDDATLRAQFATFTNNHYGADFGAGCFYDTDCLVNNPAKWTPTSRAWRWQKCHEVAWLQTAPQEGSMRSASLTLDALKTQCRTIFGEDTPSVDAINAAYGGAAPRGADWVFYSQGSDDPWRPAGVMAPLSPTLREYTAKCDGCGHCKDLHSPADSDPDVIRHQRQLEAAFVSDALRSAGWTFRA